MIDPRRSVPILATLILALAACSASGTSGVPAASATDAPIASPPAPAATEAANPGTLAGVACDLLTTAEVEAASGQSGVVAQQTAAADFEGESQCGFVANGVLPVVIVTITGPNTNTDPNGYMALPESVRLPVDGADSVWVPAAGFVAMVIKHDRVVAVQIGAPAEGLDFVDVASKLVQPVADRMP